MNIKSSLLGLRILTVFGLLLSVNFIVYSQANNLLNSKIAEKQLVLTHPINYYPQEKAENYYTNQMFRSMLPETLNVYAIRVQFKPDINSQTTGDGRFDVSSNYPDSVDA